jgi:hypothetical protein
MEEFLNGKLKAYQDIALTDPRYRELLAPRPLTPEGLLTHPGLKRPVRRLLSKMTGDTWDMCENIAYKPRVTMQWNLLREYMANRAKYPPL